MLARRFTAILLLLLATGNAAAPRHPDSPAGREAFNKYLASAQTAWRDGRTADALRWYHSAKKVARAHNLTLIDRDGAFIDFVTRHEAGLAGPQPGRTPGCDTDGVARQQRSTTRPPLRVRRITDDTQAATAKTIPPPQRSAQPLPESPARTIPGDRAAGPLASPKDTSAKATPPSAATSNAPDQVPVSKPEAAAEPETVPAVSPPPAEQDTVSPGPAAPEVGDEPPASQEPAPPIWPDSDLPSSPGASDPADLTDGDELVPPVSPARTSAPPAPPRPTPDTIQQPASSTDTGDSTGASVDKASVNSPLAVEDPVRLAADHSAVPIPRPVSPPSSEPPPADDDNSSPLPRQFFESLGNLELTAVLFGPIVLALFILGLLTQEMPGPSRMLAWIAHRGRRSNSPEPGSEGEQLAGPTAETDIDGQVNQVMLSVRFGTRRRNKVDFYTATIELPGIEPTRVVKRRDGSPLFHSKGAAVNSARHLALRLGFDGIVEPPARSKAA